MKKQKYYKVILDNEMLKENMISFDDDEPNEVASQTGLDEYMENFSKEIVGHFQWVLIGTLLKNIDLGEICNKVEYVIDIKEFKEYQI